MTTDRALADKAWALYCTQTAGAMSARDFWHELSPETQARYLADAFDSQLAELAIGLRGAAGELGRLAEDPKKNRMQQLSAGLMIAAGDTEHIRQAAAALAAGCCMAASVERLDVCGELDYGTIATREKVSPDGDYVRYTDHAAQLAAKDAAIDKLLQINENVARDGAEFWAACRTEKQRADAAMGLLKVAGRYVPHGNTELKEKIELALTGVQ